ncbi:unnamed protein product [Bursaphelenchus okinawaensis]|uniref:Uncharacterized protein n=1 Tax=Bursaphelenchus okinawaensis TaxID=465554 RepID=A0A811KFT3_9BILA|nr:unnamed protein product [Bursaphelenchus okinawaensis]CAG9102410.1 unnamed protein product [Bursaphelenchus okinawaensis]
MYRLGSPRILVRLTLKSQVSRALYSTQQRLHPNAPIYMEKRDNRQNDLLAPSKEFPFNGNVAAAQIYLQKDQDPKKDVKTTKPSSSGNQKLTTIVKLLKNLHHHAEKSVSYVPAETVKDYSFCFDDEVVTIESVECPRLLKNQLRNVFEVRVPHFFNRPLTVINIFQQEAQTFEEVAPEDKLDAKMLYFIETADAICESLNRLGYWCDYLDPHSGQARRAPDSAVDRLLKPNDNLKQVGFNLEEVKRCMKISNVSFDNKNYIGSIFTDAKVDEANVNDFFEVLNGEDEEFRQK